MVLTLAPIFAIALSGALARADRLILDPAKFGGSHETGQPRGREASVT